MSEHTSITADVYARIVKLRQAGYSCRDTAETVGCQEWQVTNAMRRAGLNGKIKARSKGPRRTGSPRKINSDRSIVEVLSVYDSVYIERGLNGGVVVTLDEQWTGSEKDTVPAAVRSAMASAEQSVKA